MVDADELLERIRRARDWAMAERDRCLGQDGSEAEQVVSTAEGVAFRAVAEVLDEILTPGKHPMQR